MPKPIDFGRCVIIAEVGSNHLGDHGLARAGIAAAVEAGADVVKFQMYRADRLVDDKMPVLKYIAQTHRTQRERFASLQLPESLFEELARMAEDAGISYMVTPFYEEAVPFLDPLVPAFKLASGDLTNHALLDAVAATGKPVLLSTGLSSLDEVDRAVARMAPDRLHLLHCVGAYPTPDDQVNLASIPFLARRYGLTVGYSDHSVGVTACLAAVALGARIIEKHFMPDLSVPVADKALSVGIEDFRRMVSEIRRIEAMIGQPGKSVQPDEEYFQTTLRRSLYADRDIPAGQAIERGWLVALRPWLPDAVSPAEMENLIGHRLRRTVASGSPIMSSDLDRNEES